MVKKSYRILTPMDKSFADTEIALQTKDGVGVKPMPILYILLYIGSALGCFNVVTKSFIVDGGPVAVVLFCILWAIITAFLLRRDKTGRPFASLVPVIGTYLPKSARNLICRKSSKSTAFYALTNIKDIDHEGGCISFLDGTYGYLFRIVGNGSVLLFEKDRDRILDRCDTFLRKMTTEFEIIFVTAKEPQKIVHQLSRAKERMENLEVDDPDLQDIAHMVHETLARDVGKNYRSLHQYMIVKANNLEALKVAKNILMVECESSTLMFKQCTALFDDNIDEFFASIFKGEESL